MRFQSESIVHDLTRAEQADESLVQAILEAGEDVNRLVPVVAGRSQQEIRSACERLFLDDRGRAILIVQVGIAAKFANIIRYAERMMDGNPYYDAYHRGIARHALASLEKTAGNGQVQRTPKKPR